MSQKDLVKFFAALGAGNQKKASQILETVVRGKMSERVGGICVAPEKTDIRLKNKQIGSRVEEMYDDVEDNEDIVDDTNTQPIQQNMPAAGLAGAADRLLANKDKDVQEGVEEEEMYDDHDLDDDFDDLDDVEMDDLDDEEDPEKDLRDYIEDCVLNTQMDIDEVNQAVHNEFAGQYPFEVIERIYYDVVDGMPELN
jgi:hypothetical protein